MSSYTKDPWTGIDNWTEAEGRQYWTGYADFLDRISTVGDDERTVAMEVFA